MQTNMAKNIRQLADGKHASRLSPYPIDMSPFLALWQITPDATRVPINVNPAEYHPTIIAQYALVHWNQYLTTNNENYRSVFLAQAYWLIEYESRIGNDAGGWPISLPPLDAHNEGKGICLSALAQGNALSVLVRAYQLTQEELFLEVARRVASSFERDILDGGVSTLIGEDGVFFEEIAVYPAVHTLNGFIFALFGLYDYVALTGDVQIEQLIHCSLATMHTLLDEFDVGFWTCSDLLHRRLASPLQLAQQVVLLEALSSYSGCEHCAALAARWKGYQCHIGSRLRYLISSRCSSYGHALLKRVRAALFPVSQTARSLRICVPITGFPVTGGTRTVLAGLAQVTKDIWQMEYLTQYIGPHPAKFVIHRFGTAKMSPWYFPGIWLYFLAGCRKLISLLHHQADYQVILPQDGIFTAAFAALAAKLAGVRVVCIDHGNLTLLKSRTYRAERIEALTTSNWSQLRRLLARLQYVWYWPSLYLLACISGRFVDHFLIPGVMGDGVEESCKRLGVHPSRITRFASMIDIDHHIVPDALSRASIREKKGIPVDAIVISLICRLTPEKGIDIALEAISRALFALPPALRERVRIIIAGDGPLHKHIEEDIARRGLGQVCVLWGETPTADAISLLGFSDIFLYTSKRGACFSMAVLEAMASACAVIASTEPMSNAHLLAEGRGIAVPPGDVMQTSMALVRLLNDMELCHQMGDLARGYIAVNHSPAMFRRTLIRVTSWSALDEFLDTGMEDET